ncbi:MAG: hypothetical protein V7771_09420 [Shewanella psychromarinicola]|jgi:hypothetical protein|uniref:hypothetical protein n=1 Tax=Shewanella TaxID=22 RepID=UPI000C3356DF|nr:hypothetical protein [Shewanella sp. Actino-trap-3]PKG78631.1 hypothetical protein CXF80_10060 [Shewanella sp. Actino-trap-3]|tara:strand:+ start:71831 stop:72790 length:960 start_codon:yes stop_codon:yes gene_type:complete
MKTKLKHAALILTTGMLLSTASATLIAGNGNDQAYPGANGQPFQALQGQIDALSQDLATAVAFLQSQIDELVNSQVEQDVLIAALQASLGALENRVLENETDIAALTLWNTMQDQLIAVMSNKIDALEARVTDNENDIAAIILSDQAMQQMIQMIKQNILIIEQRISANDGDISNLQVLISQQNTQISNLYSQLSTKQNRINGICAAGSSIRIIYANGNVSCELDNVSAGVGTIVNTLRVSSVSMPQSIFTVTQRSTTATCPSNYQLSGGGYSVSNGGLGAGMVRQSRPSGNSWYVWAEADSTFSSRTLSSYAMCMRVI